MLLHQLSFALITLNGIDPALKVNLEVLFNRAKQTSSSSFGLIDYKEYLASHVIYVVDI